MTAGQRRVLSSRLSRAGLGPGCGGARPGCGRAIDIHSIPRCVAHVREQVPVIFVERHGGQRTPV